MTYATIMVHIDPESDSERLVKLALRLANQFEATLIGAAVKAIPPIVVEGAVIEAELADEEYRVLRDALSAREGAFKKLTRGSKKQAQWRSSIEPPTDFIAREARATDLVVVDRDQVTTNLYQAVDPAGLILRAGRPVLTVPKGVEAVDTKSVLVAWKDTREARRAVHDALPLLHKAKKVVIAEVAETGEEPAAHARIDDVVHFLGAHGIKASAEIIPRAQATASNELIRLGEKHDAGIIVAGAYGHSRLGEWIFGGVTRNLLKNSPTCCLFSH